MKKRFSLFLIILFSLVLTACGKNISQTENPNVSQTNNVLTQSDKVDTAKQKTAAPEVEKAGNNKMKLQVGKHTLTATLVENSSTEALKKMLEKGPVTIKMHDYGSMEKVGSLGTYLPRNDEQITTKPGDLILYQGNSFVIYYAPNSWNFTRIGKIDNITQKELKEALGKGDVTVTLTLD